MICPSQFPTRPDCDFTPAEAAAILGRRLEYLKTQDPGNWHVAGEVKSLLWLIGQYQGTRPQAELIRIVRRRMDWLTKKSTHAASVELSALKFALRERLAEGDGCKR